MLLKLYALCPNVVVSTEVHVLLFGSDLISKYDNVKLTKIVEDFIEETGRFRL